MPNAVAKQVRRMYKACFSCVMERIPGLDTFVLFSDAGQPTAFLSYEHRKGTIWNVCKDLASPVANAAGNLFTMFLQTAPEVYHSRKQMILMVELKNPYFKRAMDLYMRHGFKSTAKFGPKARVIKLVRRTTTQLPA